MSAYTFLFLAFTFGIANRLYHKHVLYRLDSFTLALTSNLPGTLIILPFAWSQFPELLNLTAYEITLVLVTGILWSYVMWVGNITTAISNLSFQEVIRQTRTIWVVLGGVLLLGETLTLTDTFGILLIIFSIFIISYQQFSFREQISPRTLLLSLSVTFVAGVIALLEKIIVTNLPVALYTLLAYLSTTVCFFFFLNKERISKINFHAKNYKKEILFCGIFMLLTYYFGLKAYQLLPVSIAYPIIQSSTVVAVLLGTYFFEENKNIFRKLCAAVCAVVGILIIKLM